MASKPCQRSLAYLRKNGWTAAVVERWLPPRGTMKFGVRQDVWNFGDLLACRPGILPFTSDSKIALVQTTSGSNLAAHRTKILAIPEFRLWKAAGGIVLLHGWAKRGPRGKRKTWTLKEEVL